MRNQWSAAKCLAGVPNGAMSTNKACLPPSWVLLAAVSHALHTRARVIMRARTHTHTHGSATWR
jgi:hypothetical protein